MPTPTFRILCVDDDDDVSLIINTLLHQANSNYEIQSIKTPEEGLRLATIEEFDLYVLDYRYPQMSGLDLCRRIHHIHPHTPILFFTGEARDAMRQQALEACAQAYLVKPGDLNNLAATVERLIGG
jgi:CheY-like chemotaxis protein